MAYITIDISTSSIVLHCTSCGIWHAFADDVESAHDSAVGHEQRVHKGENQAERARTAWRSRARARGVTTRR